MHENIKQLVNTLKCGLEQKKLNIGLSDFVKGDGLEVPNEISKEFDDFFNEFEKIYKDVDINEFEEDDKKFISYLCEYFKIKYDYLNKIKYFQTNDIERTNCIKYIFDNFILRKSNKEREYYNIGEDEFLDLMNFISKIVDKQIEDNLDADDFIDDLKEFYLIEEPIAVYLYGLIKSNEDVLFKRYVINNLKEIKNLDM